MVRLRVIVRARVSIRGRIRAMDRLWLRLGLVVVLQLGLGLW